MMVGRPGRRSALPGRAIAAMLAAGVLGAGLLPGGGGPLAGGSAPAPGRSASAGQFAASAAAADPALRDVEAIRARLVEILLGPAGPPAPSDGEAERLLAGLQADGRWPDINYGDNSRASWSPAGHVRRCMGLAQCYRRPGGRLSGNPAVRDKINLALRWWTAKDPQCPNWWWNRIGVPEALARTLLLLGDEFPADLTPGARKILLRADETDMTGQNTLWVCNVRVMRGCIEKSPETAAAALRRIADEIKISAGEGVQADFSFHQHGAQLYSGGYGRGFAVYGPQLARLSAGTAWAMPPEKLDILSSYLLDGEQWMIRGDRFIPSVIGREITRREHSAAPLAQACDDLIAAGAARRAELQAFARRLRGDPAAVALSGNRHFWRSDFMAHQRPGWCASVRMFSSRTIASELVNGEGKKSHHLADGLTLLVRSGREFDGVPPAWDWKRLPGTTCEQGPFPPRVNVKMENSFVGGASDGLCGAAAMDLKRGGLTARKAWFFFDDCMVALGTGITCTTDNRVLTGVEQRPLRGQAAVFRSGAARPAPSGGSELRAEDVILHDGFAYAAGGTAGVRLQIGPQRGSWREINDSAPDTQIAMDMFSMWIDHGIRPAGAEYCYVVADAGRRSPDAAARAARPVQNTPRIQAARHPGTDVLGAVFWQPGALTGEDFPSLAADKPCIVLMHRQAGRVALAAANPENKPLELVVEVGLPLEGEGCTWLPDRGATAVCFSLPGGLEAGRSTIRELKLRSR